MRSLSGSDGITSVILQPRLRPASIYIITWFFSIIANIVNCNQISTYISQVTGNHPTFTKLSMAKHIFDPGPTQGSMYMFLDKEGICIKCFQSTPTI
jgi:hypothetical protein